MGDRTEEVEITLRAIGPARPSRLRLPSHIEVRELRKRVAADRELPVEQLKLVLQGEVLHDIKNKEDVCLRLKNGDSLIVAVRPKPPAKSIRDGYDDNDEDDDLRQQGDLSAYSIFNEDFRELPGTLNADRLDRDIRTGQF